MSNIPLTALRAFEKVAEHLSFTRAAASLHVTQSAVSQQVAQLEARIGKLLIERSGRSLRLTDHGEVLAAACARSFSSLEKTLQQISRRDDAMSLRFKLPPTFAMKWLMPKLPSFQVLHPTIELQISTHVQPVDFETEDVDIGMQRASVPDPALHAITVMDERGILVCSPSLWKDRPAETDELRSMTLLCSANRPEDWMLWRELMGTPTLMPANQIQLGFSLLVYQAAIEGLGLAIAQPEFVADDLAMGRLIAPFQRVVTTPRKHFLVCPTNVRHQRTVAAFFSWVQSTNRPQDG